MHSHIIDVGAATLGDVIAVALGFWGLTEVLLLIQDVVLGASNDASILDAANCLCDGDTREDWVRTEAC